MAWPVRKEQTGPQRPNCRPPASNRRKNAGATL